MSTAQSPLFEPVLWDGTGLRILDETLLPQLIEYIEVTDVAQAIAAVRDMKTRAFGQVLTYLYSGALLARNYCGAGAEPLRHDIRRLTEQFRRVRPTFDFVGLGRHFEEWFAEIPADAPSGDWIVNRSCEFASQIIRARLDRAGRAAAVLPSPARVLTHCNVSGELVEMARQCDAIGKPFSVIATETRPYLQGARLTAWELARGGVQVALIPDCAIAQVMARGAVNAVITGADRVARNGDIVNKVGTYSLALMARQYEIPFYALVQDPRSLASGRDVHIEERPVDELLVFQGKRLVSAEAMKARYPAFDVTPAALISRLIAFDEVYTPESFRRRYQDRSVEESDLPAVSGRYVLVFGAMQSSDCDSWSEVLKTERADGVLVPEMRPKLWGVHDLAPRLLRQGATPTLISDSMMGALFARGEICKLYLYCSAPDEQGPRGICGSLLAVSLAHAHGVPIELRAGGCPAGSAVDADVSTFMGAPICPPGASIFPIEAEVVPWDLLKSPLRGANESD